MNLFVCFLFVIFVDLSTAALRSQNNATPKPPINNRPTYAPQRKVNPFTLSGQSLVDYVNKNGKWRAQYNVKLGAAKSEELSRLAGVKPDFPQVLYNDVNRKPRLLAKKQKNNKAYSNIEIPREFDARKKWHFCSDVIGNIYDQSLCGSCWIVSSATSFSDRLCIYTHGKHKPQISVSDGLSCCQNCGEGCIGGYPNRAFEYMQNQGIVSGGNYTDRVGCKPYIFPPCKKTEQKVKNIAVSQCDGVLFKAPKCIKTCRDGFDYNYYTDRFFASQTATFIRDPEAIQRELLIYGPLVFSGLQIYEDFLHYKTGVYEVTGGRFIGLHAIKVIGWGVESDGTPYWLVANSWGRQWGFDGYFKIRRNTNEAGIEGLANSAYPDLQRSASAFAHL
ncbi:Cathepsin B-like cysteine proteinase 6 [Aphelenchoides bicaudatus]|nr:Cathepsin B-like cysteine proteinase 6 [Aphelenchoides bicaudatus]